jgi:Zn-dependent membrane protease YugP
MFSDKDSRKPLKPIIVANLAYCLLTIGCLFFYKNTIKPLGVIYFTGEVLIIIAIVFLELKALNTNS